MNKILSSFVLLLAFHSFSQRLNYEIGNAIAPNENVAFTGTNSDARLNYGLHLNSLALSYSSVSHLISYDQHVDKLHGGLGVQYQNVSFGKGIYKSNIINIGYAFQQNLGEKFTLSAGVGTGFYQRDVDFNPLGLDSTARYRANDLNYGIVIYHPRFFIGVQNEHYAIISNDDFPSRQFSTQFGYHLTPFENKDLSFDPIIVYRNRGGFQNLNFRLLFTTNHFTVGAGILSRDSYQAMAGYYFKGFQIKYGWSKTFSPISINPGAVHEFVLQYNLPFDVKRSSNSFDINLF